MDKFFKSAYNVGNVYYVIDQDSKKHTIKDFQPSFFFESNSDVSDSTDVLSGRNLHEIIYDNTSAARDAVKNAKLYNQAVYGTRDYVAQFIAQAYPGEMVQDFSKINVGIVDIECDSRDGFPDVGDAPDPINAITFKTGHMSIVFGLPPDNVEYSPTFPKNTVYYEFETEEKLLKAFLNAWQFAKIDIITGWNTDTFDIPYMYFRIEKVLGRNWANKLSPWGKVNVREYFGGFNKDQVMYDINIRGVASLDYLIMYKKFRLKPRTSYSLEYISQVELGEGKVEFPYDYLWQLYVEDYDTFIEYNYKDVALVSRLNDKLSYLELAVSIASAAKCNFADIQSPVKTWESLIYHYLVDNDTVGPVRMHTPEKVYIEGGYVHPPQVGKHKWVAAFDLTSLYPSIVRQYNLGPESMIDEDQLSEAEAEMYDNMTVAKVLDRSFKIELNPDHCMSASGFFYNNKERTFFNALMTKLFVRRKDHKGKMLDAESKIEVEADPAIIRALKLVVSHNNSFQHAIKILLNAGYGAMANEHFTYYDHRIAESITTSGQLANKWVSRDIAAALAKFMKSDKDYFIAGDTDSVYFSFEDVINQYVPNGTEKEKVDFLDEFCGGLMQSVIKKSYQEMFERLNCREQLMFMDREVIASTAIWVSKKHYAMVVHDNEGVRYAEPELKIVGLDIIKSIIPDFCSSELKELVQLLLDDRDGELPNRVDAFEQRFIDAPIEDKAASVGVTSIGKWVDKNNEPIKRIPIGSRAAHEYNRALVKFGLKDAPLKDGDKIKYINITKPNPFNNSHVVGYIGRIPPEFELDKYIDNDVLFNKVFINPLRNIADAVNASLESKNALQDLI